MLCNLLDFILLLLAQGVVAIDVRRRHWRWLRLHLGQVRLPYPCQRCSKWPVQRFFPASCFGALEGTVVLRAALTVAPHVTVFVNTHAMST